MALGLLGRKESGVHHCFGLYANLFFIFGRLNCEVTRFLTLWLGSLQWLLHTPDRLGNNISNYLPQDPLGQCLSLRYSCLSHLKRPCIPFDGTCEHLDESFRCFRVRLLNQRLCNPLHLGLFTCHCTLWIYWTKSHKLSELRGTIKCQLRVELR
jgi:hypothetical protein